MTAEEEIAKLKEIINLNIKERLNLIRSGIYGSRLYHNLELLKDLKKVINSKKYDEYIERLKVK